MAEAFSDMAMPWSEVARQLGTLEQARHRLRSAVFALGLTEGMTIAELARLYGFSRQLAARIAREVRQGQPDQGPAGPRSTPAPARSSAGHG